MFDCMFAYVYVVAHSPTIASALTIGYVTGIQGAHENGTQIDKRFMQAGACCKHYVRAGE